MKSNLFIILFFILGIAFGTISASLAFLPATTSTLSDKYVGGNDTIHDYTKTTTNKTFDNADFGTLAAAIISATCFIVTGNLIKSKNNTIN